MKTEKKIAVGLAAALVVAMIAAGAVSMVGAFGVPVMVNVRAGSDVTVTMAEGAGDFGDLFRGAQKWLNNSLELYNGGDTLAKVEVNFLAPHVGGVYGLVNVANNTVIPASNFEVGTRDNGVALANNGAAVDLGGDNYVGADETIDDNVKIDVPQDQLVGLHGGIIELTFSDA